MFLSAFWGDVRREFMQRLFAAPHGSLGSELLEVLQEGSDDIVACLPFSRAHASGVLSSLLFFGLVFFTAFLVEKSFQFWARS
jgi:hypothetical protein